MAAAKEALSRRRQGLPRNSSVQHPTTTLPPSLRSLVAFRYRHSRLRLRLTLLDESQWIGTPLEHIPGGGWSPAEFQRAAARFATWELPANRGIRRRGT